MPTYSFTVEEWDKRRYDIDAPSLAAALKIWENARPSRDQSIWLDGEEEVWKILEGDREVTDDDIYATQMEIEETN